MKRAQLCTAVRNSGFQGAPLTILWMLAAYAREVEGDVMVMVSVDEIRAGAGRWTWHTCMQNVRSLELAGWLSLDDSREWVVAVHPPNAAFEGPLRYKRGNEVSAGVKRRVLERDRHRCVWCGARRDLTVDHIRPKRLGGTNHISNLRALCRSCNSSRGARPDREGR